LRFEPSQQIGVPLPLWRLDQSQLQLNLLQRLSLGRQIRWYELVGCIQVPKLLAHGAIMHAESLLALRGDAGIEAGANHFGGLLPLAKNLPGFPTAGPRFCGHFATLPAHGRRLSFSAIRDSS
jgi:hypothetical protein